MTARDLRRCGSLACLLASVACGSAPDVVGVVLDGVEAEPIAVTVTEPDGSAGAEDRTLLVSGRPTRNWPFSVAAWPLDIGLAELFDGDRSPPGARVELRGEDAAALLRLVESTDPQDLGPSQRAVAVRDERGDLYLLVIHASEP